MRVFLDRDNFEIVNMYDELTCAVVSLLSYWWQRNISIAHKTTSWSDLWILSSSALVLTLPSYNLSKKAVFDLYSCLLLPQNPKVRRIYWKYSETYRKVSRIYHFWRYVQCSILCDASSILRFSRMNTVRSVQSNSEGHGSRSTHWINKLCEVALSLF